jgi:decaprenylphospho-beta-D-ribofuranose 2-oxidase
VTTDPPARDARLSGWGRTAPTRARLAAPRDLADLAALVAKAPPRGLIARGLGRSYGDAAQNAGGVVVDCAALPPRWTLDERAGEVTATAGVSLHDLMRALVPRGWFVPVTPGTRYVTVGGAIAADVHGKNHHADCSFGAHVRSLTLVTADGRARVLGPGDPLFWATVGGMGLTGLIAEATFGLIPIETSRMRAETERTRDLDHTLELMTAADRSHRYTVAWIDLLATGARTGRGVITRGDHARRDDLPRGTPALDFAPGTRLAAPPYLPGGLLNRLTVRAFNELWYARAPRRRRATIQPIAPFFHPLDSVRDWNRIYGPRGFVQYQFVVPTGAEDTLRRVVARLAERGVVSFLTVLKRFGAGTPAPLSFPMPGWTLALDIPAGLPGLAALLRELDERVAAAGGRVYLAKDARLRADMLPAMYPRLDEWRKIRRGADPDGRFRSDLARRLDL